MNQRLTILYTFLVLALTTIVNAQESSELNSVAISTEWKSLLSQDDIQVEYKVQKCSNLNGRDQVLVLFRFTNSSTAESKKMSWSVKEFRDGVCTNCSSIDIEQQHSLLLEPGEVVEADGTSKTDNRVYVFSHFMKLVPGMTHQKLTDFEFINLNIENQ